MGDADLATFSFVDLKTALGLLPLVLLFLGVVWIANVIVDFLFTNNGDEAVTLDPVSLVLLDAERRKSEPDTDTFGYIPPEQDVFLNQVNPGVTDEGRVIFTVAPDASGFTLRLGDAAIFGGETGLVELGF